MLVRLLYCSRAVDASELAIEAILREGREHNQACGITGILCYGDGVFLQCIEGGRMQVSELFATPGAAQDQSVFKLASDVSADQTTEIARMQKMLAAVMLGAGAR